MFQCPFCKSAETVPRDVIPTTKDEAEEMARKALNSALAGSSQADSRQGGALQNPSWRSSDATETETKDTGLRIRFRCPQCQNRIRARPEKAGRIFRCPFCRNMVVVPADIEPTMAPEGEYSPLGPGGKPTTGSIPKPATSSHGPPAAFRPPTTGVRPPVPATGPAPAMPAPTPSQGMVIVTPEDEPTRPAEARPAAPPASSKPATGPVAALETNRVQASADKVFSVEKFFRLMDRCVDRLERECLRVLGNEKLTREQKERFVRQQLEANYQEVSRFQDFVRSALEKRKQEFRLVGPKATPQMEREIKDLELEMGNIDLLIALVFSAEGQMRATAVPDTKASPAVPAAQPAYATRGVPASAPPGAAAARAAVTVPAAQPATRSVPAGGAPAGTAAAEAGGLSGRAAKGVPITSPPGNLSP